MSRAKDLYGHKELSISPHTPTHTHTHTPQLLPRSLGYSIIHSANMSPDLPSSSCPSCHDYQYMRPTQNLEQPHPLTAKWAESPPCVCDLIGRPHGHESYQTYESTFSWVSGDEGSCVSQGRVGDVVSCVSQGRVGGAISCVSQGRVGDMVSCVSRGRVGDVVSCGRGVALRPWTCREI